MNEENENHNIERKPWKRYGVSRTTYWRWEKNGTVPPRFPVGPNTKGCLKSDIDKDISKKRAAV